MKRILALLAAALLVSCDTDASVASRNISLDADMFRIERRVTFYNTFTDTTMYLIEGRCSISDQGHQLEVTCKRGPEAFSKDFLRLSDNVTYIAQQLGTVNTDVYRYKFVFKPEAAIPNIEIETSR